MRCKCLRTSLRGAEIVDRSGAIGRPRPPLPFDAGVIDGKPGIPQHDRRNHGKAQHHHFARRAMPGAETEQGGERHADIIGMPLLQTERAWRQVQDILEEIEAADGQRADDGDNAGGGERRVFRGARNR